MEKGLREYTVHKFGGTSLADAARFRALKTILAGKNEIVVVSAIAGVTTQLQSMLDAAKSGQPFSLALKALLQQHLIVIEQLFEKRETTQLCALIQQDVNEIQDILHAVQLAKSYAKEIQDLIIGYGEIWSANILAHYLNSKGNVLFLDASTVLFVFEKNGLLMVDWQKSQAALETFLKNKSFDQLIITGFIASTLDGRRTILGRNGSDFSAAIFARLFNAGALYIWKDVDGLYTADPKRVRDAFVIEELSYKEALELAYFGTKVLHPMTIAPALQAEIPIYIKNSQKPAEKGTLILAHPKPTAYLIKGLTCIDDIALINIEGAGMIGVSGIAARVFGILQQAGISVILISQASSEHSICFAVTKSQASNAEQLLQENLQFEIDRQQIERIAIDKDCAILAAVGDGMVGAIGISGRLCSTLAKANINIRAISQGSSERNVSVVIKNTEVTKALKAVHAGFYLSQKTISIGLIGPGQVGKTLLKQIHQSLDKLKKTSQINLAIRGIMNSKKMLLSHQPIDLAHWQAALEASETVADIRQFAEHILADDVPHAVIIDCTASEKIASQYMDFLDRGIDIITPNKQAVASDLQYYKRLKEKVQEKNRHFLYETTVCAGLPVIGTLQDLVKTGDEILKIEGVVSGTLSYLFNELSLGKPFSQIILNAKTLGYTEADPREDLSGKDVARKLVCLAREVGHEVSLSDVQVEDLMPLALKKIPLEEFFEKLPAYDKEMARLANSAYVGTIAHDGKMTVAVRAFKNKEHPFARLTASDTMLIFHTQRYTNTPLIIQGPGAGAEVTAAGIFADLLRLVSFLA